jgi:hypothetical protein
MTACFVAINSIIISGIAPKQNAFKFKIAPHEQKPIVKRHNGKPGTVCVHNSARKPKAKENLYLKIISD